MPKFNLMSYILPPEDKMFFTYFQDSAEICQKTAKEETKAEPEQKAQEPQKPEPQNFYEV